MQKIMTFTLLQMVLCIPLLAQWEVLNEGKLGSFHQIDFVSDNVGWGLLFEIYSKPNTLLKTNDFGRTWSEIDISKIDNMNIREIEFVSDSVGWVLAGHDRWEANKLYYTDNGGDSWEKLYESSRLEHICVTKENIVFVVKDDSEVLKITDNDTFEILSNISISNFAVGMWFKDSNVGFVTDSEFSSDGDKYLYATTDGGNTWEKSSIPFYEMRNLQFFGDSLIYFTGNLGLYKSTDTLQTWLLASQPELEIENYHIISPDSIFLITRNDIRLSVDGGMTSEIVKGLSRGIGEIINFNSRNEGFITTATCLMGVSDGACLTGRMDFRSEEKGKSWTISELSYPISELCFVNEKNGFAAGGGGAAYGTDHGEIFVTNDGGSSWELSLNSHNLFSSVQFFGETTGYVLKDGLRSDGPIMLKTSDGGDSWQGIYINDLDYYGNGNAMYFMDENRGWYVDNSNDITTIWGTKDGGQTWANSWASTINSYSRNISMHFSGSVGWVVSSDSRIIKYENDKWQEINSPTTRRFDKVYFFDAGNGWICSEYNNDYEIDFMLFRTEDSGATWDSSEIDFKINDLYFKDSKTGWAVGKDTVDIEPPWGVILHTMDGGLTWTLVKNKISGELNDIHFQDGYLWAAGNNGLVLKITDKITGVEKTTSDKAPNTFTLSQNYPNPFNPTTIIEYHVGSNGNSPINVDLSIYNLLGQKIATLVSEKQPVGTHKVEWDASGFPSGVYTYRIQTEKFTQTKKLLLLK